MALVSARRPGARRFFTSDPVLLLADGRIRGEALRRNRLTESELRQAVRMQGTGDLSRVEAVVLETNGKLSVITSSSYGDGSALADVRGTEALGDDDPGDRPARRREPHGAVALRRARCSHVPARGHGAVRGRSGPPARAAAAAPGTRPR